MHGYKIVALDGNIGSVYNFYFDEVSAHIRYLVVSTGSWLFGKRVLLSPVSLGKPDWASQSLRIKLSKEQVKNSPDIDLGQPISRPLEDRLHRYYNWPIYWTFPSLSSQARYLWSSKEVEGYHIEATDGQIGHIEDLIVDDEPWIIRYIVVDTHNLLPGKKVIISPAWLQNVDWFTGQVAVNLSKEEINNAPEYDPSAPVNRQYEERLYDFYGRPRYWL
jgi:hypothetical protein